MYYWFVFIGNNILLRQNEDGSYSIPRGEQPPTERKEWEAVQELPKMKGTACRAYSLKNVTTEEVEALKTMDLRSSYNVLDETEYLMAGKAYELLYWDSNTQFCGCCGAPMKRNGIISKQCTNCGKTVWPQVAPAIIVRIRKKAIDNGTDSLPEQILMVHARNFRRKDYYGLVAGFVETGETLEECVRREVGEETGITIENIRYFASQPWPYPSGIMVGFTADYVSGSVHLQEEELSRGGWFDRDHMPPVPDKLSIARRLIDDWLEHPDN